MKGLLKKATGFTIIELLLVIVVVGILAAIVLSAYSGVLVSDRNSTRQTDIKDIRAHLESFYTQNGYYPSLGEINNSSWRDKNMPQFNPSDMIDPSAKDQNSADAKLAAQPAPDIYAYVVSNSDGGSCQQDASSCAKYTLTATFEGKVNGQSTFVEQNLD